ncbi:MAG: hypothetical protein NT124_05020 [Candidatus Dependentiae bacterium]|nr:hypothetical protein [Candidatus Dependentiae bacterium]
MFNAHMVELIINSATLFIGYCASVTLAGAFRAWVAKQMGDDTAESLEMLSLNPIVHVNMLGVILLLVMGFGWGTHVPVNPFNIVGRWRGLRIFCATFSDVFAYIIASISAMVALLLLFDTKILLFPSFIGLDSQATSITDLYPHTPSFLIIVGLILINFIYLNVILGAMHTIMNGTDMAFLLSAERSDESYLSFYHEHTYSFMLVSLILYLFLSHPLRILLITNIIHISLAITQAL